MFVFLQPLFFLATVLKKLSLTGAIMYFRFKLRLISTSFPIIIQIFSFINIVSWSHEETIFVGLFLNGIVSKILTEKVYWRRRRSAPLPQN